MFAKPTEQIKDTELLIRLSTQQKKQIKAYAKKNGVTMATAIRIILENAINGEEKKGE